MIQNNILIVAGSLVGASGIILTSIMCKAMNRSLTNVLVSGFGATSTQSSGSVEGEARPISPHDTYVLLEAADVTAGNIEVSTRKREHVAAFDAFGHETPSLLPVPLGVLPRVVFLSKPVRVSEGRDVCRCRPDCIGIGGR